MSLGGVQFSEPLIELAITGIGAPKCRTIKIERVRNATNAAWSVHDSIRYSHSHLEQRKKTYFKIGLVQMQLI